MSSKTLSIIIAAKDQATSVIRGLINSIIAGAGRLLANATSVFTTAGKITGSILSLKNALIATIATLGVNRLVGSLNSAAEKVAEIAKVSLRLGVGVEQLSALRYAAEQADVPFDSLATGVGKLARNLDEFVRTGGGVAAPAIRRLNVELTDANGRLRSMSDLFPEIAQAIQRIQGEAGQLNMAEALFGRGNGKQFIDLLRDAPQFVDDLSRKTEEARRLGVLWTGDTTQGMKAYTDSLNRISQAWLGLRVRLLTELSPVLTDLSDRFASFIAAIPKMAGNLSNEIHKALSDTDEGVAAREKFRRLGDALTNLIAAPIKAGGVIAVDGLIRSFDYMADVIATDAEDWGNRWGTLILMGFKKVVGDIGSTGIFDAFTPGFSQMAAGLLASVDADVDNLAEKSSLRAKARERRVKDLIASVTRLEGEGAAALRAMKDEAGKSGAEFASALEDVVGYTQALADTSVAALRLKDNLSGLPSKPDQRNMQEWRDFLDGVKAGYRELRDQVRQLDAVFNLGAEVAKASIDNLSSGWARATVENIGNIKKMRDAYLAAGADMLKMAGEMIVKFLLVRAITGIAESFAAPSGPVMAAFAPAGGLNGGGWANPVYAAAGTWVPGPNVNRDIIRAMLTPGERVLSRPEVSRMGGPASVDALARGGSRGGVSIHQEFNFASGASVTPEMLAQVRSAAAQGAAAGVLDHLQTSPDYRSRVRSLVGGS